MFELVYYNIKDKPKRIRINEKDLAILQYDIIKDKYQYCAVVEDGKIILGQLLENHNKN